MKDLNKLYRECLKECKEAGIKYGNIESIKTNTRYVKKWGNCKKVGNKFIIQISVRLLQDDISDIAAKETIIHEILHTVKDCMNHKQEWKYQASLINKKYPQYNIKRTTSFEDKGINKDISDYKYIYQCDNCKSMIMRVRKSRFTENYHLYSCGKCGSRKLICLKYG